MGNKQSKNQKSYNYHHNKNDQPNAMYTQLIVRSNDKHNHYVLNSYLRLYMFDETKIFPKSTKEVIIDYASFAIPDILLFLERKIDETSNNFQQIGMFKIEPDYDKLNKAKQVMFDSSGFWNSSIEEMETIISQNQFGFDCNVYTELLKVFFRELHIEILDFVEYDKTLEQTANNSVQCVKYLNEKFANNTTAKTLYWWLMDILVKTVKNEDKNNMDAKTCSIAFSKSLLRIKIHSSPQFTHPNYDINVAFSLSRIADKIVESSIKYLLTES
eukprot:174752_1